jgi:cell division protein FtsB
MKVLKITFSILKNKYVLTIVALVVWLLFFDKNDVFTQYDRHEQVQKLEQEVKYFRAEIARNRQEEKELQNNPKLLEKFAREHYLMKKDNEEIYILVSDSVQKR